MRANHRQNQENDNDEQTSDRQPVLAEAPRRVLPQAAMVFQRQALVVENAGAFWLGRCRAHCALTRGSNIGYTISTRKLLTKMIKVPTTATAMMMG